jgi:hypothetical protein
MATRRELDAAAYKEFQVLQAAWFEEFVNIDDAEGLATEDLNHIPPAVRHLTERVLEEGLSQVNEAVSEQLAEGKVQEGQECFDAATSMLLGYSRMLAWRFYKLGVKMVSKLPPGDLTPCPCSTLADEDFSDIEQLLRESAGKGGE